MQEPVNSSGTRDAAPAVLKAGQILAALEEARSVSLAGLARHSGIPKSSTLKICRALESVGLIERVGDRYRLGRRLGELGTAYLAHTDEVRAFHEVLLSHPEWPHTFQLASLTDDWQQVVHLAKRDGSELVRLASDAGRRLPSTCAASGKAILATLPLAAVRAALATAPLVRLTDKSVGTVEELVAHFQTSRASGWAVDDEESSLGVVCVASAIPHPAAAPIPMAVSVTFIKAQVDSLEIGRRGAMVTALARAIGERLGAGQES
jgi:DNA-binding IclR family transcriptional regulator